MTQWIYEFGDGKAEGSADMRELLGGKGANLAEMSSLGLPVPPGFTITTEVCTHYTENGNTYPDGLDDDVAGALKKIETTLGRTFGGEEKPLLVSVRSGSRASMPGMMDTVLNLGLNDTTVEGLIKDSGDERFALDSYRRFIQMYGDVVLGVEHHNFEDLLEDHKADRGVDLDTELNADDLRRLVDDYLDKVEEIDGKPFPQPPADQLWGAIGAVFGSWMNDRAITYRRLDRIPGDWGTAVNIQAMVFGNMGDDCATGVCFTRNPSTGDNSYYGEFLLNAQGGRGRRHPHPTTPDQGRKSGDGDGPAVPGRMPARYLHRPARRARQAGKSLHRHAGYGIYGRAGQVVDVADANRKADSQGGVEDRRRHGGRGPDRTEPGDFAHRPVVVGSAPASDAGPGR